MGIKFARKTLALFIILLVVTAFVMEFGLIVLKVLGILLIGAIAMAALIWAFNELLN